MEYRCNVGNALGKAVDFIQRGVTFFTAFIDGRIAEKQGNKNESWYSAGAQSGAGSCVGSTVRAGAVACSGVMLAS